MTERFHPRVARASNMVEKLADGLQAAIDVQERQNAKRRAIRERLLARAAKHDV
jgi:hypothetical protein